MGRVLSIFVIALMALSFTACLRRGDRLTEKGSQVSVGPSDSRQVLERKAVSVRPSGRQIAWQKLEFQAFVHFGLNTFIDREWGTGQEEPALFDPSDLDPDQWVRAFKAAGMKGVIITAKHHDGFCLWPSRYTAHSVASSPWKNGKGDAVKEVAEACRKGGLKFGFYLSPWDRHEPSYGDSPRYNEFFKNQLSELLTGYGEISEVWFDGARGEGPNGKIQVYDWPGFWQVVRRYQPQAVISIIGPDVRWVGNEAGRGRRSEWSVVPATRMDDFPAADNPQGAAGLKAQAEDIGSLEAIEAVAKTGGRLIWYPAQVDVSIRPGWFYHGSEDGRVKSLDRLLDIYYSSVGGNTQLLLNVPPDQRGLIHENDVRRLTELGLVLNGTFAVNLSARAEIRAAGRVNHGFEVHKVFDGDPETCWMPPKEEEETVLEFLFSEPVFFNVAMIQENIRFGQRIEEFIIEAATCLPASGRETEAYVWNEISRGTTVGYKRLVRFPAVSAKLIRLRITDSRSRPTVAEFGLFLDPERR